MREVIVSEHLWGKIKEVNDYLINELHLSEEATEKRIRRMEQFVMDFAKRVDHPLCRFKKWRTLGYHCAVFEKDWVPLPHSRNDLRTYKSNRTANSGKRREKIRTAIRHFTHSANCSSSFSTFLSSYYRIT